MRTITAIFALLFLAMTAAPAHARGMGAMDADEGDTHASSDLGGEYVDEDDSTTDDLGSEDLDEGDVDPADQELEESDPQ